MLPTDNKTNALKRFIYNMSKIIYACVCVIIYNINIFEIVKNEQNDNKQPKMPCFLDLCQEF